MGLRPFESQLADLAEPTYPARELTRVAGLSYRQINDWDGRRVLRNHRKSPRGWRLFSAFDILAVRIIADVREQFGVPLGKLKYLYDWMIGDEPIDGEYSGLVTLTALGGLLLKRDTDLTPEQLEGIKATAMTRESLLREPGREGLLTVHDESGDPRTKGLIRQLVRGLCPIIDAHLMCLEGYRVFLCWYESSLACFVDDIRFNEFSLEHGMESPVMLFPINNSVNSVLTELGHSPARIIYQLRDVQRVPGATLKDQEREVLDAIRDKDVICVTVRTKAGEILQYERRESKDMSKKELSEVVAVIKSEGYEDVIMRKANGKVVRVDRVEKRRFPRGMK